VLQAPAQLGVWALAGPRLQAYGGPCQPARDGSPGSFTRCRRDV